MPADLGNCFLPVTELLLPPADLSLEHCPPVGTQKLWGGLWASCGRVDLATPPVIQLSLLSGQQGGGGRYEESFPVGQEVGQSMPAWGEF